MSDHLFGEPGPKTFEIDPEKDYFAELVGEQGKYKTPQDLAKSRLIADNHISQLEFELKNLREELGNRERLSELIDKAIAQNKPSPPPQNQDNLDDPASKKIDPSELAKLVDSIVSKKDSDRTAQENAVRFANKLKEQFGESWQTVLRQKTSELGFSQSDISVLAAKNPDGLYRMMVPNQAITHNPAPPRNGMGTDTLRKPDGNVRNAAFYEAKKKEMGLAKFYSDHNLQAQMHKDATSQGESFFN